MAGPFPTLWRSIRGWFGSPTGRSVRRHVLAWAAISAVILLVHRQISAFVAGSLDYEREPYDFVQVELPEWMEGLDGATGLQERLSRLEGTLFDDESVARAHDELAANPWVREVIAVRRDGVRGVEVEVDLRRPAVAVNLGTHLVLVDMDRVRLPGDYGTLPECVRPPILDLRAEAPEPGRVWDAPEIDAAFEMMAMVERSPLLRELGVTYVRIDDAEPPRATFVLSSGARVVWGAIPSQGLPGEPAFDEKLDRLRRVEEAYPGLHGVREVSLDTPLSDYGRSRP